MREQGELAQRLIEAMQGGEGGTTSELAVRLQADVRAVREILRLWLDAGIVHVSEVVTPRRTLVYRYGAAPPEAAGTRLRGSAVCGRPPSCRPIAGRSSIPS